MPAAPYTLKFHAGQRVRRRWRVGPRGGPWWDFTGWGLHAQARTGAGLLVADLSSDAGGGITLADGGTRVVFTIAESVAATFAPGGCYRWDLWARSPDGGFNEPLLAGPVVVLPSVTRAAP